MHHGARKWGRIKVWGSLRSTWYEHLQSDLFYSFGMGFMIIPVLTIGKQRLRELELLSQGCTISAEPSWLLSSLGLKTPKARSTGPDGSSYGIWGSWWDIERDKWRQTNHHHPVEDQSAISLEDFFWWITKWDILSGITPVRSRVQYLTNTWIR